MKPSTKDEINGNVPEVKGDAKLDSPGNSSPNAIAIPVLWVEPSAEVKVEIPVLAGHPIGTPWVVDAELEVPVPSK